MAEIEIDDVALEIARREVEDVLVDFRDNGRFMIGGNGFVIRNQDGSPSEIMRLSTAFGLRTGIKAYLAALANPQQCLRCTSPYRHHRFVMRTADGTEICPAAWHDQAPSDSEKNSFNAQEGK